MSYEIDYSALEEPAKSEKAVADCKAYLTKRQWRTFKEAANHPDITQDDFVIGCGFIGIQGFPAIALFKHMRQEGVK